MLRMRNTITGINAGLVLMDLGDTKAKDVFEYFKLRSVQAARSKIAYLNRQLAEKIAKIEDDTQKDVEYNLFKDAVQLEHILNRPIDIDKATVTYWIELNKLAKKIVKANKK